MTEPDTLDFYPDGEELENLLAVIHCDGGHYMGWHGRKKATTDAMRIVLAYRGALRLIAEEHHVMPSADMQETARKALGKEA